MCRISSADCFISGFTASQSTLFCEAKYSVLHFAHKPPVLLPVWFQSFLYVMHWKTLLKKPFSTCIRLHFSASFFFFSSPFFSYESTKDKLFLYHIWTLVRRFAGVFCKSFLPPHYNWKVTSRLSGYFTKIFICFLYLYWKSYT